MKLFRQVTDLSFLLSELIFQTHNCISQKLDLLSFDEAHLVIARHAHHLRSISGAAFQFVGRILQCAVMFVVIGTLILPRRRNLRQSLRIFQAHAFGDWLLLGETTRRGQYLSRLAWSPRHTGLVESL